MQALAASCPSNIVWLSKYCSDDLDENRRVAGLLKDAPRRVPRRSDMREKKNKQTNRSNKTHDCESAVSIRKAQKIKCCSGEGLPFKNTWPERALV